jgi:hypothetical protein
VNGLSGASGASEHEDAGEDAGFEPSALVSGCGAVWCADYGHPLVVRVDPATRAAQVWAAFPPGGDGDGAPGAGYGGGPRDLAVGLGAVWVLPAEGTRLVRIDPEDGGTQSHELPFPLTSIAAGADAIFGIGETGDGRIARFSPGSGVTSTTAGQALRLIAAGDDLVWTVDDAAGRVAAFAGPSLEPVAAFDYLGAPDALCARGTQAWYVATPEATLAGADGRPHRGARLGPDGFTVEILRLDAATGATARLGELPGVVPQVALAGDRLWIAGPEKEPEEEPEEETDEDPVSPLRCLDLDGRPVSALEWPGQIDALVVDDAVVWVAGFRRSRQAQVLAARRPDGTLIGEVSFAHLDLGPPAPPAPEPPARTPAERARDLRDQVQLELSAPREVHGRFGERWTEPPVSAKFRLERVELRGTDDAAEIAVLFRWSGEDDLFGLSYPLSGDEESGEMADAFISVYVEENLVAGGYGLANAIREPAGGVTWLRWPER